MTAENQSVDLPGSMWQFRAKPDVGSQHLNGVVDGDTLDLEVDLGFRTSKRIRVRVLGVNTNEVWGVSHDSEEYKKGAAQSEFVREWVSDASDNNDWPFYIVTEEGTTTGSFRRWLAHVYRIDTFEKLDEVLVSEFDELE